MEELFQSVIQIGQFFNTQNWSVQFKDKASFESALGRPITIGTATYVLKNANEYENKGNHAPLIEREYKMKVSMRVHWLPSGFSSMNVEDFINESKFLKVIDINREKWKGAEVQNGVLKVKVEFNVDDYERLLEWAGISIIGGCSALIQCVVLQ